MPTTKTIQFLLGAATLLTSSMLPCNLFRRSTAYYELRRSTYRNKALKLHTAEHVLWYVNETLIFDKN